MSKKYKALCIIGVALFIGGQTIAAEQSGQTTIIRAPAQLSQQQQHPTETLSSQQKSAAPLPTTPLQVSPLPVSTTAGAILQPNQTSSQQAVNTTQLLPPQPQTAIPLLQPISQTAAAIQQESTAPFQNPLLPQPPKAYPAAVGADNKMSAPPMPQEPAKTPSSAEMEGGIDPSAISDIIGSEQMELGSKRFGWGVFEASRKRIERLEAPPPQSQPLTPPTQAGAQNLPYQPDGLQTQEANKTAEADRTQAGFFLPTQQTQQKTIDARIAPVGPVEMSGQPVNATPSSNYQLSTGDQLFVTIWGSGVDAVQVKLTVDADGGINVPKAGYTVVRGMTLEQFQGNLKASLRAVASKDMEVVATLERLKSMRLYIVGEAFRPGSYEISSASTLFNALYACGGPSEKGSLRDVRVMRKGQTFPVDLYDYLVNGKSQNDIPLLPDDVVFIAPTGVSVSITGSVKRPGAFELRAKDTLKDLLSLAAGPSPDASLEIISVLTFSKEGKRELLTVDFSKNPEMPLKDGDLIWVPQQSDKKIQRAVVLSGAVKNPGIYELKTGMKVADLLKGENVLASDAYMERAEIIRFLPDLATTEILPFSPRLALSGEGSANRELRPLDKVIIHSRFDIQYKPQRQVTILGAVAKPGDYRRHEGMKVSDLIVLAGGFLPNVSSSRADLVRFNFANETTRLVLFDAGKALSGDSANDILLDDADTIRIYTQKERAFAPEKIVNIAGAVQRPGNYPRHEGMRVLDLVELAGGTMPSYYPLRANLIRKNFINDSTDIIHLDLPKVFSGDASHNLELSDQDSLRVYDKKEVEYRPDREVHIYGAVQRPGTYKRHDGMTANDLLLAAGGLLREIDVAAQLSSIPESGQVRLQKLNAGEIASNGPDGKILLSDGDLLMFKIPSDIFLRPEFVSVLGEVKYPGVYMLTSRKDTLSDVIERAGGLTPAAYAKGATFRRLPEKLAEEIQSGAIKNVNEIIGAINTKEYIRQVNKLRVLWGSKDDKSTPEEIFGKGMNVVTQDDANKMAALAVAPSMINANTKALDAALQIPMEGLSIPSDARKLTETEIALTGIVQIDLQQALTSPHSQYDMPLLSKDEIYIPKTPSSVGVVGAVAQPTSLLYDKEIDVEEYIAFAGNANKDGDLENGYIFRINGGVLPIIESSHWWGDSYTEIEPGDIIFIPTKVTATEIVTTTDKVLETVRFGIVSLGSLATLAILITLF